MLTLLHPFCKWEVREWQDWYSRLGPALKTTCQFLQLLVPPIVSSVLTCHVYRLLRTSNAKKYSIWNAGNNANRKQLWCSQVICHQGRQTAHALRLSLHGGFFSFASPLDGARQDPNAFAGLYMNSWIWHLQDKTAPRCEDSQKLIHVDSLWWQV